MNDPQFTPALGPFFWWMVALITLGAVGVVGGGIAQLVAWIGALVSTSAPADRTWFVVLLIAGVAGLVGLPGIRLPAAGPAPPRQGTASGASHRH